MEIQKPNNAKITFLYLLSLVALVFVAISSGIAIFQMINKYIVDFAATWGGRYLDEAMKFAISSLIIATPVYYVIIKFINKEIAHKRLDNHSAIRRWLTYLILLITAVIILVWLIITLNRFFEGELTTKSILKTLTILVICGGIFSFYLYDIKRNLEIKTAGVKVFFYSSLIAIIVVLIGAFFTIDSPNTARNQRIDSQTVNKLNSIYQAVNAYHTNKGSLPSDMDELLEQNLYPISEDTITNEYNNKKIKYLIINDTKYELCTDFLTASSKEDMDYRYGAFDERWNHDKGYQCLELEVNNRGKTINEVDLMH